MWANFLITYLHYTSFIIIGSALFTELLLVKNEVTKAMLKKIVAVDAFYGIFAIVLVSTGLLRVFYYGKRIGVLFFQLDF